MILQPSAPCQPFFVFCETFLFFAPQGLHKRHNHDIVALATAKGVFLIMSEKDMAQKIKELRIANDMTLEQVADIVGVGKSTVRKWETGMIANMRRDKIGALAKALQTTPAYLMGWEEEPLPQYDNIFPIDTKKVPLLGEIACGKPIFAEEHFEAYVECGTGVAADFALRCKGDSMSGARIQDGDLVFIRKQEAVENGQIAAVIIDDEATLKRVFYADNMVTLVAENAKYPPIIVTPKDHKNVRILGKAIAFQSDVR